MSFYRNKEVKPWQFVSFGLAVALFFTGICVAFDFYASLFLVVLNLFVFLYLLLRLLSEESRFEFFRRLKIVLTVTAVIFVMLMAGFQVIMINGLFNPDAVILETGGVLVASLAIPGIGIIISGILGILAREDKFTFIVSIFIVISGLVQSVASLFI